MARNINLCGDVLPYSCCFGRSILLASIAGAGEAGRKCVLHHQWFPDFQPTLTGREGDGADITKVFLPAEVVQDSACRAHIPLRPCSSGCSSVHSIPYGSMAHSVVSLQKLLSVFSVGHSGGSLYVSFLVAGGRGTFLPYSSAVAVCLAKPAQANCRSWSAVRSQFHLGPDSNAASCSRIAY